PVVVELWPGKPPEEPGTIGPEKVVMSPKLDHKQVEVTDSTRMITNVTKPTLTIYRPAKEKDTRAAVIICPGGGYWNLYWELEGEEVAAWLNTLGVTGIILKYRVPRRPDEPKNQPARRPLQDAQRAVSLVRSRAAEWGIDPKRIGIIGFSAGGHLAVATARALRGRNPAPIGCASRGFSSRPPIDHQLASRLSRPSVRAPSMPIPSIVAIASANSKSSLVNGGCRRLRSKCSTSSRPRGV